jgi:predicted benzoate:H+ symporter BenE
MWTAATLAVGLLVFKSIPVVVVCLLAFLALRGPTLSSRNASLERTRER